MGAMTSARKSQFRKGRLALEYLKQRDHLDAGDATSVPEPSGEDRCDLIVQWRERGILSLGIDPTGAGTGGTHDLPPGARCRAKVRIRLMTSRLF